ncbi:AmmeMemoRadiSam system radical SAM enzyme [candidate division KSB1 bacterium]|nr:AmmeMemoRadiSam system radical SAM enzyme [candidate division KSB1 bacterium]
MYSRRKFIRHCGGAGCFLIAHGLSAYGNESGPVEARYYQKLDNRKIKCELCPRECVIDDLERGYCGVRENRDGTYYSLVYGLPCSVHADPVEKKPLFHFLPSTRAFSIATVGCNVMCKFCQNWEISQTRPEQIQSYDIPPSMVVKLAQENRCASIAYTYTEPVIFTEYMYDTAELGRKAGVKSVMISNGYINPEPMMDLCGVLDGVKIDLKAYTERFYKELVSGELRPVLDTLVLLRDKKMWTEIVYLVIPGQNDDPGELKSMCNWIAKELGPDTPLHFSRFHPQYRLKNIPATPVSTLKKARQIGLDNGLFFVYIGNVPGDPGESTYCPDCGIILIQRIGYQVVKINLKQGSCPACGRKIAGVW